MFTLGDVCTPHGVQQYLPLNIRVKLHFYLLLLLWITVKLHSPQFKIDCIVFVIKHIAHTM
jgi:hypothetical protein